MHVCVMTHPLCDAMMKFFALILQCEKSDLYPCRRTRDHPSIRGMLRGGEGGKKCLAWRESDAPQQSQLESTVLATTRVHWENGFGGGVGVERCVSVAQKWHSRTQSTHWRGRCVGVGESCVYRITFSWQLLPPVLKTLRPTTLAHFPTHINHTHAHTHPPFWTFCVAYDYTEGGYIGKCSQQVFPLIPQNTIQSTIEFCVVKSTHCLLFVIFLKSKSLATELKNKKKQISENTSNVSRHRADTRHSISFARVPRKKLYGKFQYKSNKRVNYNKLSI